MSVAPATIEKRLVELSKVLDDAHNEAAEAEKAYYDAKSQYEIGIAKARMTVGQRYANRGVKVTVQEREDEALLMTDQLLTAYYNADALVRAARANLQRVRTQVDIARSVSASVRSSLEL